ncbi:uncharacterized membrane protein At3g27390 isoform X2 [Dioscorea cayenensis subsp. rotundata]|uniref:Uncharacterized membrane protein At3g27390 isoform X2 n=1 Tax=Dioscorea cayennensis subsp. rotundata TaxID=55577 RepID=A0AB40BY55_DIOCR|nr:uncharacterized membrane protein At3g27390 isoform X2 [Dioscorea cayenensis subsp. rotundata]
MEVPIGSLAKLWSFISFLPFFSLLLLLGILKAVVIGPIVAAIIFIGNSAVIIGLWPAHLLWTYYCVIKTRRFGLTLKMLVLVVLPVPLVLWPVLGVLGSLALGIGYGYFTPLIATFEAVGEHVADKLYHCFIDGCWSSIRGGCTVVSDFLDVCFHSYFSYMDDLSENIEDDEKPLDVELTKIPGCVLVCLLALPIDVPVISTLAVFKSPYMLLKGWQRLFHDLIGREGPFLETVCVPFAGLAIILWPIAVTGAVVTAFICSFFLGFYGGIIAYQEDSLKMGLAYIVSVISLFDEYTNDLLYLREGSCFPRLNYRKHQNHSATPETERKKLGEQYKVENDNLRLNVNRTKLAPQQSKTLKKAIQQLEPIQIWDWLFRSCELNGRILMSEGLIRLADIEECIIKGRCKKLSIRLPAWCILHCLLQSAKSDSHGLLIYGVELTDFNWPKDKVLEWLLGPLIIMKEQIKQLALEENEENYLRKLIMAYNNDKLEDWDESGFPSDDNVRRAQLQAILRRLQGIVASMTRIPGFRRRFNNLIKAFYLDSVNAGSSNQTGTKLKSRKSKDDDNNKRKARSNSLDISSSNREIV